MTTPIVPNIIIIVYKIPVKEPMNSREIGSKIVNMPTPIVKSPAVFANLFLSPL